jgi:hypothetical protein
MFRLNRWSGAEQQQHVQAVMDLQRFQRDLNNSRQKEYKFRHEGAEYVSLLEIEIKSHEC